MNIMLIRYLAILGFLSCFALLLSVFYILLHFCFCLQQDVLPSTFISISCCFRRPYVSRLSNVVLLTSSNDTFQYIFFYSLQILTVLSTFRAIIMLL